LDVNFQSFCHLLSKVKEQATALLPPLLLTEANLSCLNRQQGSFSMPPSLSTASDRACSRQISVQNMRSRLDAHNIKQASDDHSDMPEDVMRLVERIATPCTDPTAARAGNIEL
jgi:hypothetical protein